MTTAVERARRDVDALEGILEPAGLQQRRQYLDTVEELQRILDGDGKTSLGLGARTARYTIELLIKTGLEKALEGLDRPDRLATSYRIADRAREIGLMAQQLVVAESIFESDMSDADLETVEQSLMQAARSMEMSEPALTNGKDWMVVPEDPAPSPSHTYRGGTPIPTTGVPYGTTHDMGCPACVASGLPFESTPRSETFWAR